MDAAAERRRALKGTALVCGGVLWLTPDSLLIKLATRGAASQIGTMEVLFWRLLLYGLVVAAGYTAWAARTGRPQLLASIRRTGRLGALVLLFQTLGNLGFVQAQSRAPAAKVLVLVAMAPIFSAVLARVFLKERLPLRTAAAIVVSGAVIVKLFSAELWPEELPLDVDTPELASNATAVAGAGGRATEPAALQEEYPDELEGLLWAMQVALTMGSGLVVLRRASAVLPGVSFVCLAPVSGALLSAYALLMGAAPLLVDVEEFFWLFLQGAVVLPVSLVALTIGPMYIPAAEVSLILLLETALGPLWVFLALGEEPAAGTLLAGAALVLTLAAHSVLAWREAGAGDETQTTTEAAAEDEAETEAGAEAKAAAASGPGGWVPSEVQASVCVLLSGVIFSFGPLFFRSTSGGASAWLYMFWRFVGLGAVACGGLVALTLALALRRPRAQLRHAVGGLMMSGCNVCFIVALDRIDAATVLLLQSLAPWSAALLAWLLLREPADRSTKLSMLLATVGVGVMGTGWGEADALGLGVAMLLAVLLGSYAVMIRASNSDDRAGGDDGVPAAVEGALLLALWTAAIGLLSSLLVCLLAGGGTVRVPFRDGLLGASAGGLCLGVGLPLYSAAGKYIPAARTNLLLLSEILLAPTWTALFAGEEYGARTLGGGALLLAALVWLATHPSEGGGLGEDADADEVEGEGEGATAGDEIAAP